MTKLILPLFTKMVKLPKLSPGEIACYFVISFCFGMLLALGTLKGVYYFSAASDPKPTELLNENCYIVVTGILKMFSQDPSMYTSKFVVQKFNGLSFFEKYAKHQKIRNDYYRYDPLYAMGSIFTLIASFLLFRIVGCCYFKNDTETNGFFLYLSGQFVALIFMAMFKAIEFHDFVNDNDAFTECLVQFYAL